VGNTELERHDAAASAPDGPSDDALMQATAAGDMGAFETLVRRYERWAWALAFRFFGDAAAAEDLVQTAFLNMFAAASSYRPDGRFRGYLRRALTRLCIDAHRRRAAIPEQGAASGGQVQVLALARATRSARPAGGDLAAVPDPGAGVIELCETRERRDALRRALAALPDGQRLAIIYRYFDGLGHEAIAAELSITAKAAEALLARARRNLLPLLKKVAPD
jgi:RNA polymerase sigma-70 factor (ECF subfamily)